MFQESFSSQIFLCTTLLRVWAGDMISGAEKIDVCLLRISCFLYHALVNRISTVKVLISLF